MGNEPSQQNIHSEHLIKLLYLTLSFFVLFYILLRDKIATGSFDKTCKLWCAETAKCFHTFRGHMAEIVCMTICFKLKLFNYCLFLVNCCSIYHILLYIVSIYAHFYTAGPNAFISAQDLPNPFWLFTRIQH